MSKRYLVKSTYPEIGCYEKWTEVSQFLATGLVGVNRKKIIEDENK